MILSDIDKQAYSFGRCHIFSLALSRELGYTMQFCWYAVPDLNNLNEDEPESLIHAYSVNNKGEKFDINGKITIEDIETIYQKVNYSNIVQESDYSVNYLMEQGILAIDDYEEITLLQEHIRENIHLYQ
jgi:hypothetical protein